MARKRILSSTTSDATLAAAGIFRNACLQLVSEAPIGGPAYQQANAVMDAIDGLAEVLTGDRTHFHLKPHAAP